MKYHTAILIWLICLFSFLFCGNLKSRDQLPVLQDKEDLRFYFRFNCFELDSTYMSNLSSLQKLDSLMHSTRIYQALDSFSIRSYASPEGDRSYNEQLAARRSQWLKSYMRQHYSFLRDIPVYTHSLGENWQGLTQLVIADQSLPAKANVMQIIHQPISSAEKELRIKQLQGGKAWSYIEQNMLRYLRSSSCVILYMDKARMHTYDLLHRDLLPELRTEVAAPSLLSREIESLSASDIGQLQIALPSGRLHRRFPPFALKTNLLFDLASALNVEIEFPIRKRFSVAADWVFPWWTLDNGRADSKRSRLQVLNGNIEGRYWFGNREEKRLLNGWFTGFYAGGGLYDVEWKGKGIQGEFFIAAGVSGGFAHKISRRLSLEYALGVGIMRTGYRSYEAHFCQDDTWYPIREKRGQYTWIGPTRVKVSLVWLIQNPQTKGGGR